MRKQRSPLSAALPDHKVAKGQYLYAIEFHDGAVKIGVTWNPAARVACLCSRYKKRAVKAHASPITKCINRHAVERHVLLRCLAIGGVPILGKELFAGLRYGAAVTLIKQMAPRKLDPRVVFTSQTKEGRKKAEAARKARMEAEGAARFARVVACLKEVA